MLKSIACALALAASLPIAAVAASEPVVAQEVVRFDDLNLANPKGVQLLQRRIESAARRVCGYNEASGFSLILRREVTTCMDNALASARQQVAVKTGAAIRKG